MTKRAGLAFKPWTSQSEHVQNAVIRAALDAIADKTGIQEDEAKVRTFMARWVKNNYCGAKRRALAAKAARRGHASGEDEGADDFDAPVEDAGARGNNGDEISDATTDDHSGAF